MHIEPSFHKRYHKALRDTAMLKAVKNGTGRLRGQRATAIEGVGADRWMEFRNRAEAIRLHVIQHLDQYLEQLVDNVIKNGGHVCLAKTGEEAVQYIAELAKKKNAKTILKSKSMVSEEIHLNPALEQQGCNVIESDLGEWIIQLAGETPSHIIAPAMHKNRFQVADLFNAVSEEKVSTEIADLCGFARKYLREKFLGIDIGITGCNFALADSGAITLCTNEGNARIISTLAPTLVTIMGMERILPGLEELTVMLSLLARSATGQKLTVYNTLSTGVRNPEELDGPQEFHLVIVDNGRSKQLGTKYEKILNCIRCGSCLNACPVYRNIGGHAYGWVYPGPIGAVLSPLYQGMDKYGELAYATTLCGACTFACPVKIPLHDMLYALRNDKVELEKTGGLVEDMTYKGWSAAFASMSRYRFSIGMARRFQFPLVKAEKIAYGPPPISDWLKHRDMPALPKKFFHEIWREMKNDGKE
ncbi:L-lactate dehydrogenase complex protein LldF [Pelosinus fermentans]|uniref:LutB/LldF family L-lactate oxidation iron-sulfur protein n=1 Tax=Pelosinus fermentans TaxID=365349 RepID=UPI0002684614|nr:LutB/LldF family L-lactate oxidation iron-sulfur protein [Pelosinus fermentans]OAM95179.1 iron-sulfur cluster binding protein [Pelosinus fermentans DSM 17108]SDR24396.1 L-lactate dehydrogenase complex protein LldF [Pelosinus fermentans]